MRQRTKATKKSQISTRKPPAPKGDILSAAVSGASAMAGIASGTLLGNVGGTLAAVRTARDLAVVVRGFFSQRQERRVELLLEEAYFANAPDEAVAVELAKILEDTRAQRVLMEAIRAALESISEAVIPALAALMRDYQRTGTEPDAFFRGLCRVLQEVTQDEYAVFVKMLHEIVVAIRGGAGRQGELLFAIERGANTYAIKVEEGATLRPPGITFRSPHLRRLMRLLGANELGRAADIGMTHETVKWAIEWDVLTRVERIVTGARRLRSP